MCRANNERSLELLGALGLERALPNGRLRECERGDINLKNVSGATKCIISSGCCAMRRTREGSPMTLLLPTRAERRGKAREPRKRAPGWRRGKNSENFLPSGVVRAVGPRLGASRGGRAGY